jgi:hypothetical protein
MQPCTDPSIREPARGKAPAVAGRPLSNADLYAPKRKEQAPRYSEERCVTLDPNFRDAPVIRVRAPREAQKRRAQGCTDCRFIIPRLTFAGLRVMAITLAVDQRCSDWPRERARYPKTLNYHVTAALNDYLQKMGYAQFCVPEEEQVPGHVRRFSAPNI